MYVVLFWPLFSPGGRGKPWFKHDYSHHDTEINRRAWNLVQSLSWHFSGGKFPLHFPPTLKASPVTPTVCQSQQQNSYPAARVSPTDWLRCAHTQVLLMHSWAVFLCPHLQMSVPQNFWGWLTPSWPLTHKFWPAHDLNVWAILSWLYFRPWLWAEVMCPGIKLNSFWLTRRPLGIL